MAASLFSRLYRKVMTRTLVPLGFKCKEGVFWRERNEILHFIDLHRTEDFTVDIAIQPLVDPYETFSLVLGDRLYHFGPGIPPRWEVPEEKAGIEEVLDECVQAIVKYAIPWLDRFQSTKDIVEIDINDAWGVRPPEQSNRLQFVALCTLDAGMFDRGYRLLKKMYQKYYSNMEREYKKAGIPVPEWAQKRRQMYRELLELLEQGDLDGVRRRLEDNKAYTRAALGLS